MELTIKIDIEPLEGQPDPTVADIDNFERFLKRMVAHYEDGMFRAVML